MKRVAQLGVILTAIWLAWFCARGIASPWDLGHNGYNGSAFLHAARNSLRFGTIGQAQYYTGLAPPAPTDVYTHHPLLIHAHLIAASALFGVREWAGRLVPALYTMLCFGAVGLIVRRYAGGAVALGACAIFALCPIVLIFANMIDHEQGGIFWCLVSLFAALSWAEAPSRSRLIAALAAISVACQFDWPGYYIAFLIALGVGALGVSRAVRARAAARWRPEFSFVVLFSAVVLANFFAFFAWIAHVRGGLDEMILAFDKRTKTHGSYEEIVLNYALDLYGPALLALLATWVLTLPLRLRRREAGALDAIALAFLIAQTIHSCAFQTAGRIHSYWIYYLAPAIAIGGAVVCTWIAERLAERFGRRAAYVTLGVACAAALLVQLSHIADRAPVLMREGSGSYIVRYRSQRPVLFWMRHLGERYERGEVSYRVDPSLGLRIEGLYYLDAPYTFAGPGRWARPAPKDQKSARAIVIANLERAQALAAIARLARSHAVEVMDGWLAAVDLSSERPSLTFWTSVPAARGALWRHLAAPGVAPARPVARGATEAERASWLRALAPAPWRAPIGGGRGGRAFEWRCPPGWSLRGIEAAPDARGRVVSAVRGVCEPPASMRAPLLERPVWFGGDRSGARTQLCAPGASIVALRGRGGTLVDSVAVECSGGGLGPLIGGRGGKPFRAACPPDSVAIGLRGRAGSAIDAVGPICAPRPSTPRSDH